ncbi:hypothetical protein [Mycolicibacterium fortuitum]
MFEVTPNRLAVSVVEIKSAVLGFVCVFAIATMSAFHRPKLFGGLAEQNGNGALAWWAERQKPSMNTTLA